MIVIQYMKSIVYNIEVIISIILHFTVNKDISNFVFEVKPGI